MEEGGRADGGGRKGGTRERTGDDTDATGGTPEGRRGKEDAKGGRLAGQGRAAYDYKGTLCSGSVGPWRPEVACLMCSSFEYQYQNLETRLLQRVCKYLTGAGQRCHVGAMLGYVWGVGLCHSGTCYFPLSRGLVNQ